MKPSQLLLELARNKASLLTPGTQIRLTAEEESFWVLKNRDGKSYIGTFVSEIPVQKKFFKNKPVLQMVDNNTNEVTGFFQSL